MTVHYGFIYYRKLRAVHIFMEWGTFVVVVVVVVDAVVAIKSSFLFIFLFDNYGAFYKRACTGWLAENNSLDAPWLSYCPDL